MNEIKEKPFAKLIQYDELKRIIPGFILKKHVDETKLQDGIFGIVLQIKAIDKIEDPETFTEYFLGTEKEPKLEEEERP